ncbi:MAG: hypothetical protein PF636_03415 [Actinomycetota bacterium]|jgi:hypothetical protein|nr:hypothetical protein [Actinomycetota bacterium]
MPDSRDDGFEVLQRENLLLREENEHLRLQLGLEAPQSDVLSAIAEPEREGVAAVTAASSSATKIALFRSLFRGREDVYAKRWESKAGKSGYAPACANEWRSGVCDKRSIKCGDCPHRELVPLDDRAVEEHLTGRSILGAYPMLEDETCRFLTIDFDDAAWRDEVATVRETCEDLGVPAYAEISRSGAGAHLWAFFSEPVAASRARRLGSALLTRAARRRRVISLESYDRLFPSQDTLPRRGFGNLIALPLQHESRASGRSVFVDADFLPYSDQWAFLDAVQRIGASQLEALLSQMGADGGVLGVRSFPSAEHGGETPWIVAPPPPTVRPELVGHVPTVIRAVRANLLFIEKAGLPDSLIDQFVRLAAFENPEFYRAQAMRLPTYDKPRVIACAQEFDAHVGLPRGCLDELSEIIQGYGSRLEVTDELALGVPILARFAGTLRPEQRRAVKALLGHDDGVLSAENAFG